MESRIKYFKQNRNCSVICKFGFIEVLAKSPKVDQAEQGTGMTAAACILRIYRAPKALSREQLPGFIAYDCARLFLFPVLCSLFPIPYSLVPGA